MISSVKVSSWEPTRSAKPYSSAPGVEDDVTMSSWLRYDSGQIRSRMVGRKTSFVQLRITLSHRRGMYVEVIIQPNFSSRKASPLGKGEEARSGAEASGRERRTRERIDIGMTRGMGYIGQKRGHIGRERGHGRVWQRIGRHIDRAEGIFF
jgi:hypothetical protein